jgi:hypothetical protein
VSLRMYNHHRPSIRHTLLRPHDNR